jgi:type III pantothenate kinase
LDYFLPLGIEYCVLRIEYFVLIKHFTPYFAPLIQALMQTTICFDFGNTRLKYAVFEDGNFKELRVMDEGTPAAVEALLQKYKPAKAILASVIKHDAAVEDVLAANTAFHKLSHTSKLPVTTPVGKPETIGADRLALVAAAAHLQPGRHNLVVALGSCITFNFVNKFGEFLGGSISPGLEMRFKAMHEYTALLPLIKPNHIFPLLGYDTRTNMLSGAILGMAKEIDGIAEEYNQRYNHLNIFLTGGDMAFFTAHLKTQVLANPQLMYEGLYAISEINNTP